MANDNVIHLSFRSEAVVDDPAAVTFVACRHCRNKAYSLIHKPGDFPMLRCTACGTDMGQIGWAPPVDAPQAG